MIFKLRSGIPAVTAGILSSAFTPRAGLGGIIGVACSKAVRFGITRGVMSNEAGCGTAPIAHASAEVSSPVSQAFLGIIEVLFDTLLLCTLTAYVILLADVPLDGELSTVTAISAFTSVLGDRFAAPLAIAVFLFALASAAGWSYYGSACLSALGASPKALRIYNISYALCALIGAVIPEGLIWQLSDLSIYFMAFINTAAVMLLSPIVVEETKSFLKNAKLLRIKQKSP